MRTYLLCVVLCTSYLSLAGAFSVTPQSHVAPKRRTEYGYRLVDTVKALGDSEARQASSRFDCEVCGGLSDWCPVCRGPAISHECTTEQNANSFSCGVCGGASDWCPVCSGGFSGTQPIFESTAPTLLQ